jgi:hypothetical protein
MALIASFNLLAASQLPELVEQATIHIKKGLFSSKRIDNYWDYLEQNTTPLKSLEYKDHNGGILLNVLTFLGEKHGINLTSSEFHKEASEISDKREASTFILTHAQKTQYLDMLDPARFDLAEIRQYNIEFEEDDDPDTAQACLEAIRTLHDNLNEIRDDSTVVLFQL